MALCRDRAGVEVQAPGGLGVLIAVISALASPFGLHEERSCSKAASSSEVGGSGSSGRFFGGDGLLNSILEEVNDDRRGGVDSGSKVVGDCKSEASGERGGRVVPWLKAVDAKTF